MNEANNRYDLLANELSMLVLSLGLRKQHELPEQLLSVMNAQEQLLENSLRALQESKQKMLGLMKGLFFILLHLRFQLSLTHTFRSKRHSSRRYRRYDCSFRVEGEVQDRSRCWSFPSVPKRRSSLCET
jgi:hypothetical protein